MKQSIQDKLDEIAAAKVAYEDLMNRHGSKLVKEMSKDIFEAFPGLSAIRWRQGTPSFNDGDPCTFRLGSIGVTFEEEWFNALSNEFQHALYDSHEVDEFSAYRFRNFTDSEQKTYFLELEKAIHEFESLLNRLEDVVATTFGDPVRVMITRTGDVEIEEMYDY